MIKYTPVTIPNFQNKHGFVDIALAIDTSGSTDRIMNDIIRETVKQLVESLAASGSFKLTLWSFDNIVHYKSIQTITERDISKVDDVLDITLSYGGGGSSYSESFHLINAIYYNTPTAVVFITDGMLSGKGVIRHDVNMEKHVILLKEENKVALYDPFPFEHLVHVLNYTREVENVAESS